MSKRRSKGRMEERIKRLNKQKKRKAEKAEEHSFDLEEVEVIARRLARKNGVVE